MLRRTSLVGVLILALASALACGGGTEPDDDGTPDAGTPDAGTPDAGTPDAGTPDAGSGDGGTQPSADVTVSIDTAQARRTISPLVYGYNAAVVADAPAGVTWLRIGGNRWTAYNWTNNYSNAGSDWQYSSDTYLGQPSQGPGGPVAKTIDDAKANGIQAIVTIPIQGWVSKDGNGSVDPAGTISDRFVPNLPKKGSAFTTTPSQTSSEVYQDEFANFIAQRWGAGAAVHVSLDNEPDLWASTHKEIQRAQPTYASFLAQSIASATAIKDAVGGALVYGPASYGWMGYVNFQSATDAPSNASIDNSFLDYYLQEMKAASTTRRLLDVLDVHYYSEARSNGCTDSAGNDIRVNDGQNGNTNHPCVVAARVQAPRSLVDSSFVETSWITQWQTASTALGKAMQVIPRLRAKIENKYPGTKLAITEYNFGGGNHVSGALAQADTLGIMGREGVHGGAYWPIMSDESWAKAAWRAYRNYDGAGRHFGDTSVQAVSTDLDHVAVYAGVDAANAGRVVLVVVHRPTLSTGSSTLDLRSRTVTIGWAHSQTLRTARAWQLSAGSTPVWQSIAAPAVSGSKMTVTLPAQTVTTIELTP